MGVLTGTPSPSPLRPALQKLRLALGAWLGLFFRGALLAVCWVVTLPDKNAEKAA
jgi:hypothetical protein